MKADELSRRLFETFLVELDEQVAELNRHLLAWEARPDDDQHLRAVLRLFHTAKGSAQVAGVPRVELAAHAIESLLTPLRDAHRAPSAETFQILFQAADALDQAVHLLRAGDDLTGSELDRLLAALDAGAAGTDADPPIPPRAGPPVGPDAAARSRQPDHPLAAPELPEPSEPSEPSAPARAGPAEDREAHVRVQPERLDALLAAATDLRIAAGRLRERPNALEELHRVTARWAAEWRRSSRGLRVALEQGGAPPAVADLVAGMDERLGYLRRTLFHFRRNAAEDARVLSRIGDSVNDTVSSLRLRPFADACTALPRAVRDVAAAGGKDVELVLLGQQITSDRAVIEALREPLLHLVRNAVDHGIESPAERLARGKPSRGRVEVDATLAADRLVVRVQDDGAGLDVGALRDVLAASGLELPEDDRGLVRALFSGGLSSRTEPTPFSGRGVGLDLVRNAVERLGGGVDVTWSPGEGTTFTLDVPASTATLQVVLTGVGAHLFAFPMAHIERLLHVEPHELRSVEGRPVLAGGLQGPNGPVPVAPLASLLGPPLVATPLGRSAPALLLHAGEQRLVVLVDELVAAQEVVIRPLEEGGRPSRFISAGAVLPNGRIALVLLVPPLIHAAVAEAPAELRFTRPAAPPRRARILVVDDSITTRTLEQSVLEAAGYTVITAVDGQDGWRRLQQEGADLVVADVEMPRMDGFALAEAIRASQRFRETPVVMVTALEKPEDRMRGLEIGADAYLAKSSFDQETLLETVRQLLGD